MPRKSDRKLTKKKLEIIQKYAKGWIARNFYRQFRNIMKMRKRNVEYLLSAYQHHLGEIIQRHGAKKTLIEEEEIINLREVCDYYIKLDKYENAFDKVADDRKEITYREMSLYFEVLSLAPTRAEIRLAVDRILGANADEYIGFPYTKRIVVDIALHIFVPKGTHLENSRRSTWLCPLVGNDDAALRFGDNYKKISLQKCMREVAKSTKVIKEDDDTTDEQKEAVKSGKKKSSEKGKKKAIGKKKKKP